MKSVPKNFFPLLYFQVILLAQLFVTFNVHVFVEQIVFFVALFLDVSKQSGAETKRTFCPSGPQRSPGWSVTHPRHRKKVPANCSVAAQSVGKTRVHFYLIEKPQNNYLKSPPLSSQMMYFCMYFFLTIVNSAEFFNVYILYLILFWSGINRLCLVCRCTDLL